MSTTLPGLSIFFPFYNEEGMIEDVVRKAYAIAPTISSTFEILMVDDGSKDKTAKVAQRLEKEMPGVRLVRHEVNKGYGAALKSGFSESRFPWITFTDGDGQFDFSEITHFIETQQKTNADLVVGYYKKRQVPFYRKLNTFLWELIVFILFGLKVTDIDCGFKLISRKVIETVGPLESERGAFISSEFLIKARKHGFKIVEIPVSHYPRLRGKGTGANLDVIIQSFVDLFSLWRRLS